MLYETYKIICKAGLGVACIAAGGGPRAVMLDLTAIAPGYTQEVLSRRRQIDNMMLDKLTPDDEVMAAIEDLQAFIENKDDLNQDDRARWEPCKKSILTYLDGILKDLELHRKMMRQMNDIASLLRNDEPCYAELKEFIVSAQSPAHLENANKFKKSLVGQEMVKIKFMILRTGPENPEIAPQIQSLMDFIREENVLLYKAEVELETLRNIMANPELHKGLYAQNKELIQLTQNIVLSEDREEAERMAQEASEGIAAWKLSVQNFGEQYKDELEELELRFRMALPHLERRDSL